tara:strand:+ start:976 stop:1170 length:195 start_codon:yes stop_codon:yes gene_type:complete
MNLLWECRNREICKRTRGKNLGKKPRPKGKMAVNPPKITRTMKRKNEKEREIKTIKRAKIFLVY